MNKKVLHAFLTPTYCKILIHFFERSHHTSDNIYLKTNMENNYYISKLPSSIFKHKTCITSLPTKPTLPVMVKELVDQYLFSTWKIAMYMLHTNIVLH